MAEILERLGSAATEEMFHAEFDRKSLGEVLVALDEMFPHEDNEEFAQVVYGTAN